MPGWRSSLASPKIESKRRLEANYFARGMNEISPSQAISHREGFQVVYAPAVALYRSDALQPALSGRLAALCSRVPGALAPHGICSIER